MAMPVSLHKLRYANLPFNELGMNVMNGRALIGCTCGQLVYEMDTYFCHSCGDVSCEECLTECSHCGKSHCMNCSENKFECIKCAHDLGAQNSKAYLVINGKNLPVKNSQQLLKMVVGMYRSGEFRLNFNGQLYDYKYRSVCLRNNSMIYDYFFNFEPSEQQIIEVRGRKVII
jgi:hypothetical protein